MGHSGYKLQQFIFCLLKQQHATTIVGTVISFMNESTLADPTSNLFLPPLEATCPYITLSVALMVY